MYSCRMCNHSRRFINCQNICIFIYNIQRKRSFGNWNWSFITMKACLSFTTDFEIIIFKMCRSSLRFLQTNTDHITGICCLSHTTAYPVFCNPIQSKLRLTDLSFRKSCILFQECFNFNFCSLFIYSKFQISFHLDDSFAQLIVWIIIAILFISVLLMSELDKY